MPSIHLRSLRLYAKERGYLVMRNPDKGVRVWLDSDAERTSLRIFNTVSEASIFLASQPVTEKDDFQYRRVRRKGVPAICGGWVTTPIPHHLDS